MQLLYLQYMSIITCIRGYRYYVLQVLLLSAHIPGYTVRLVRSLSINDKFIQSTFFPHFIHILIHNIHNCKILNNFLLPATNCLFTLPVVAQMALALYLAVCYRGIAYLGQYIVYNLIVFDLYKQKKIQD